MSWTYTPAVPTTGTTITVAAFGAPVAHAISELHTALDHGQAVPAFANATARDVAITSPVDGMVCYLQDVDYYSARINGAWVSLATAARAVGIGSGDVAAGNHTHAGSATLHVQTLTSDDTWTSGASTAYALVLLVGGGGGGSGGGNGGGGGGQVLQGYVTVAPSTSYTVTIGAGGSSGSSGGASSFGALLSAAGGAAGGADSGGASGSGVPGGWGISGYGGGGAAGGGGGGAGGPGQHGVITSSNQTAFSTSGGVVAIWGGSGGAGIDGYGGGGGGYSSASYPGRGGPGGGDSGHAATANTGGGGGSGNSGGSGLCVVTWWT